VSGNPERARPVRGVAVAEGFNTRSIRRYAAAYAQSYGGLVLSFRRTGHWWAHADELVSERIGQEHWRTVLRRATPVGYVVECEGRVVEAACVDGEVPALLAALTSRPGPLTLALPAEHAAVRALRAMNHTWSCRQSWDGGHMVRVLDGAVFAQAARGTPGTSRLERHDEAQEFVMSAVGAGDGPAWLSSLPAWSVLDEF
jgi:hypothetical protein